jgi:hypothetical protein
MIAALCAFAILAAAEPGAAPARPALQTVEMVVSRVAPAEPAMRYKLLPDAADRVPGNAAPIYLMAFELMPPHLDDQPLDDWLSTPAGQLPKAQVRDYLASFSHKIRGAEMASQREQCWWEIPYRQEGVNTLLPHLNPARSLARILSLDAKLHVSEGKFDEAVRSLRIGFALSSHLQNNSVLVQGLVSAGIASLMLDRLAELQQTAGAPNLYWALADLPAPFVDQRTIFSIERSLAIVGFSELRGRPVEQLSNDELRLLFQHIKELSQTVAGNGQPVEFMVNMISSYPAAKQYLVSTGRAGATVDAMPPEAVLAVYIVHTYQRWSDEVYKWAGLPYWQAQPGMQQAEAQQDLRLAREGNPLMVLMPALNRAMFQFAKVDRRRATLQCVAALQAYAAAHEGKLPASLDDVKETPVPTDPMTGKPFGYEVHEGVGTLHLAGLRYSPEPTEEILKITVR